MRVFKPLIIAGLLASNAAFAESGRVTVSYTPSGGYTLPNLAIIGDKRPCEFFQIENDPQWYAIPMTTLGSNVQIVKIEKAAAAYQMDPNSPSSFISFTIVGSIPSCSGASMADRITVEPIPQ